MSLLREITDVMTTRPSQAAPPEVVADWYERKAALMDAIAAHPFTSPERAAEAAESAGTARAHAAALRATHGGTH